MCTLSSKAYLHFSDIWNPIFCCWLCNRFFPHSLLSIDVDIHVNAYISYVSKAIWYISEYKWHLRWAHSISGSAICIKQVSYFVLYRSNECILTLKMESLTRAPLFWLMPQSGLVRICFTISLIKLPLSDSSPAAIEMVTCPLLWHIPLCLSSLNGFLSLTKMVQLRKPTNCPLDVVPGKLLVEVWLVGPSLLIFINSCLSSGLVPAALKHAVIQPLLKK